MNNFFCNHKTQKSDPEHTFSEIDINYRRDYSKGKSFKVSIWNEIDTYNNDDFIQDFVIYNQSLWARIDSTPSTNEVPTEGPWAKVMDGVSDVQFKEERNKIFWKYEDESEWKDLFELDVVSESEIKNMLKDIATDVDSNFYDKTLSETSINAVQNKVITQALNKKQDVISDLNEIRSKANTALQSIPSEYVTESELANKGYLTEHQDISGKQDKIADLAQIRANAQKGATALQTVPAEYATKTDVSKEVAKIVDSAPEAFDTLKEIASWIEEDAEPAIVLAKKVEQKVDKVEGLGLSEESFTAEEKEKLAGLENYDDTNIKSELTELSAKIDDINPTPMISVTYAELVALRDNGELIPGQQYRITDYVTTTTQSNTQSAGHQFDIIVTADDVNVLNENARAIQHEGDTYFANSDLNAWELKYCLDNDTERFAWASREEIIENKKIPTNIVYDSSSCSINSNLVNGNEFITPFLPEYYIYIDPIEGGELYNSNNDHSLFYEFGYEVEPNGITENLCIYKSEEGIYQDEGVDYSDKFFYRGIKEIDGEEYDYWQKCETSDYNTIRFGIFDSNGDSIRDYQYMLTSRIVTGNVEINEYKPLNYIDIDYTIIVDEDSSFGDGELNPDYSAKFKLISYGYELDNNGQRTLVAYRTDASLPDDPETVNNYRFMPDYEIPCFYVGTENVDGNTYDKWRVISDWNWDNEDNQKYYLTEQIVENGTIKESAFINYDNSPGFIVSGTNGKGIIYYMKDEYGNECPYDFKNIKFHHSEFGINVYTFTWIDNSYNVMDTSVFGNNGVLTWGGNIYGVYNNVIKPNYNENDKIRTKQVLNNITFISDSAYVGGGNAGFYGCYNNSFGNNCYNNSFGNDCGDNSFGINCSNNSFANHSIYNSFGNNCYNNSFGNNCYNNSFGNDCGDNSFGDNCCDNSFGDNCCWNNFGHGCCYNSLGSSCNNNHFGKQCYFNGFGINCYNNSFSNNCSNNSFANHSIYNSFGYCCNNNSFGAGSNSNMFGNYCDHNTFGTGCYSNSFRVRASTAGELLNYCCHNHFDDGCSYNVIWNSVQPTPSNKLQNINVVRGVSGPSPNYNFINIVDKNTAYEIKVAKNSSGDIKVYCEADLIA